MKILSVLLPPPDFVCAPCASFSFCHPCRYKEGLLFFLAGLIAVLARRHAR